MKKHDAKGSPEVVTSGRRNHHHLGIEFLNSGLAAVCAITIMNPLDVVRTRLQIQTRAHPVYRGSYHSYYYTIHDESQITNTRHPLARHR